MLKKVLATAVLTSLLITSLTGCGGISPTSSKPESTGSKTVITINNWPGDEAPEKKALYENYKTEFEKKNPDIEIKGDSWSYDVNSFLPKAASGQLPTMYETFMTEPIKIVNAGYGRDVTEILKKFGYDKEINPQYLELLKKDGKYWGIPYEGYVMGMVFNINLFKQAGLVDDKGVPIMPKTYDELAQTAVTIKEKTGKSGFYMPTVKNQGGWTFMNIAWSYGVNFMDEENGKWVAKFNTPECVQALQYVKDLKWKYKVLPSDNLGGMDEFVQKFSVDQVAMGFGSPDQTKAAINDYSMDRNNIAIGRVPAGPKGREAQMGGVVKMFSPTATDKQIEACIKWLEHIGFTPKVNDEVKSKWESDYKMANGKNEVVGCEHIQVWINEDRKVAQEEVRKPYENVDFYKV
ncbi:MAG: extracellular solute-binding protein, partial [Oscillospiraceae bacterium]